MISDKTKKKSLHPIVYNSNTTKERIPDKLKDAIEWLQKKLELVPEEYRDEVFLRFYIGFDSTFPGIEIDYSRLETDEELQRRCLAEDAQATISKEKELKILEMLREKYPGA